jgi:hypothetical protein
MRDLRCRTCEGSKPQQTFQKFRVEMTRDQNVTIGETSVSKLQLPRRNFMTIALALIPVIVTGRADAATNASLRTSLKYQDTPQGDKSCANCMQFVPATPAKSATSCKIIPGDTEISSQGYCIAWAKKA